MRKALIVEDNPTFLNTFKEAMSRSFPEVELTDAQNGEQALEMIGKSRPDIVFLDIRLPGQSGLEILEIIKSGYPEICIVILTDYDLPEYREVAGKAGAYDFIPKGTLRISDIAKLFKRCWGSEGRV